MCDVTRKNFEVLLPEISRLITTCDFICVDAEFTGLTPGPGPEVKTRSGSWSSFELHDLFVLISKGFVPRIYHHFILWRPYLWSNSLLKFTRGKPEHLFAINHPPWKAAKFLSSLVMQPRDGQKIRILCNNCQNCLKTSIYSYYTSLN